MDASRAICRATRAQAPRGACLGLASLVSGGSWRAQIEASSEMLPLTAKKGQGGGILSKPGDGSSLEPLRGAASDGQIFQSGERRGAER